MVATKFSKWIKQQTVARVVIDMRALGQDYAITQSAVYQWLRGETEPRATKIRGLVQLSCGKLTLRDVHEHIETARAARSATNGAQA